MKSRITSAGFNLQPWQHYASPERQRLMQFNTAREWFAWLKAHREANPGFRNVIEDGIHK